MSYGEIYPVSTAGRVVAMVSSFVGIAIVALPSGVITAGDVDRIRKQRDHHSELPQCPNQKPGL